jgi:GNAT superfamily N-acetyltransferase
MNLRRTTSENPDFQNLVVALDQVLAFLDGDDHAFYAQFNKSDQLNHVVVWYDGNEALGCGAFRPYGENTVEIKRMYTKPESRGKGVAHAILAALEVWAKELGYPTAILETGYKQVEAIGLYQKAGYKIIPNYGQYAGVDDSVCMQKTI